MEETSENRKTNHICVGILAHVDAGKTTLSEGMLYESGYIRKLGRVDHGNAFLDTYELERQRGITIFSKQAQLQLGKKTVTLLDTPGHVDFSAEMERTLQVLDYAVLVISGADGVQGHVQTLWRLLERYRIPVFVFVNKMDQEGTDGRRILEELQSRLSPGCLDFTGTQNEGGVSKILQEELAVCDEALLERYLESDTIYEEEIKELIRKRKTFPCFFGSALKLEGVQEFLQGMDKWMVMPEYPEAFGARIYKIARDAQGNRLTYMKITGGTLRVKMVLSNQKDGVQTKDEVWEEKADQLRIYSGAGYEAVQEAEAGMICAVTGLTKTAAGEGLGVEKDLEQTFLTPVLTYRICLPKGCDVHGMLLRLRELEEEDPQLHIVWEEQAGEIHVQVMGEIQIEILKSLICKRYGVEVEFDSGSIVYKETIANTVEGVGHFEPLRHYAEVHLLLKPGERGSGIRFSSACSEDVLDRNWQRLVLTHLEERKHRGVLTGSEITDIEIILAAGRAHIKHTEGGDFRQATYRAVRHGLQKAESVLLEPVYAYRLEVPQALLGRALNDIQKMHGTFSPPETEGEMAILAGAAPVVTMRSYAQEVAAYTKGLGRLFCTLQGYEPCHNAKEIIEEKAYDPEQDTDNPSGSVFCSHGAGFLVPWEQVESHMHLESVLRPEKEEEAGKKKASQTVSTISGARYYGSAAEKELEEIFEKTYGPVKKEKNQWNKKTVTVQKEKRPVVSKKPQEEYLLVDGYNIIFAWEELKELAGIHIESARDKLMDLLSNYQGFRKQTLILVFDAYKVKGNPGKIMRYHNIYVVFTKEAETADQYIEKTVHEIGRSCKVTVATSDALEQVVILGQGAIRMSAGELKDELEAANIEIRDFISRTPPQGKNYLLEHLPEEMTGLFEEVRLGKKEL